MNEIPNDVRPVPETQAEREKREQAEARAAQHAKWYPELLEAVSPGRFMDKRTEGEVHRFALFHAQWLRRAVDHLYEENKTLRARLGMPTSVADIIPSDL